jgi:hypothetical protein
MFPHSLRLRVPQGLPEALQLAARARHTTASEYARQALLRGLESDGVRLRDGHAERANDPREGHQRPV